MIRVTVSSADFRTQSGNSKLTGKPYSLDIQTVWFHTYDRHGNPNPFPEKGEVILERDEQTRPKVYQPGEYTISPSSLYVGNFGSLSISPKLVPIKRT